MAMRAVTVSKQGIDFRFAIAKRASVATGGAIVVSVTRTDILGVPTAVDYIRCNPQSDLRRVANRWLGGGR